MLDCRHTDTWHPAIRERAMRLCQVRGLTLPFASARRRALNPLEATGSTELVRESSATSDRL